MPIEIIRQDITKIECDAIVCPTNSKLKASGGVDKAIHDAAGKELAKACKKIRRLDVGDAKITGAFKLPCKFIIHTVGPKWQGGNNNEREMLESCYVKSFNLAKEQGFESVAFPLISSGTYGYPKEEVLKIALSTLEKLLIETEIKIFLVVYDKESFSISEALFKEVTSFISDKYIDESMLASKTQRECLRMRERIIHEEEHMEICCSMICPTSSEDTFDDLSVGFDASNQPEYEHRDVFADDTKEASDPFSVLDDYIKNMDKGFAQTLFSYIDSKGVDDVECYKNANVDKKTFSKIKCVKDYRPSKKTVVSFAISLHLNMKETEHLLKSAGYALSRNNLFDVIIEYFISTDNYKSIWDVNEVLYKFDQATLV